MARIILIRDYGNSSVSVQGKRGDNATIYSTLQEALNEAKDMIDRLPDIAGNPSVIALDLDDLTAFPV